MCPTGRAGWSSDSAGEWRASRDWGERLKSRKPV
jgi:hypothetical protein